MPTPFSDIYKMFTEMITDYDLAELACQDRDNLLYPLMISACSQFTTNRNRLQNRDKELKQFNENLSDEEIDIICHGMKVAWISPKVLQGDLFKTFLNTKDFNLTSPHQQLGQNRETEKELRKTFKQMVINYSYSLDVGGESS